MKNKSQTTKILHFLLLIIFFSAASCTAWRDQRISGRADQSVPYVFETRIAGNGMSLSVHFEAGRSFNHPLMAIWMEDMDGNYIQTLYVAQSIAQGVFLHGDPSVGRWMPGPVRRPAALPYWGHQRGIKASDGYYIPTQDDPMPDALTGPTPKGNFTLHTNTPENLQQPFRVLFEINQSWDWNRFWTNNKFPGDDHYKTSSQPALVYEAVIDPADNQRTYIMEPIGHSHWSGETGELFPDLSTITTALDIAKNIRVEIEHNKD